MGFLTKDQIRQHDDTQYEEVQVPEWGGSVLVRGLSGTARDDYFASLANVRQGRPGAQPTMTPNTRNTMARLIALCIVDPDNRDQLMFTVDDVSWLGKKSSAALTRVEDVAMKLSGLGDEEMALLGKDSSGTPEQTTPAKGSTRKDSSTSG